MNISTFYPSFTYHTTHTLTPSLSHITLTSLSLTPSKCHTHTMNSLYWLHHSHTHPTLITPHHITPTSSTHHPSHTSHPHPSLITPHTHHTHTPSQGRQEDAEEFLGCLLDGLHEEMVSAQKILDSTHQSVTMETEGSTPCILSCCVVMIITQVRKVQFQREKLHSVAQSELFR